MIIMHNEENINEKTYYALNGGEKKNRALTKFLEEFQ